MAYPQFTLHQLNCLKKASQIAAQTFAQIKKLICPGWTEKQAATKINRIMKGLGAQKLAFRTIVASGRHSAHVHHKNTTRKIAKNDIVLLDFGCKIKGTLLAGDAKGVSPLQADRQGASLKKLSNEVYFCSDFSRTIFIGKPKPEWQKVYHIVKTAQEKAMKFLAANPSLARSSQDESGKHQFLNTKYQPLIPASKLDAVARDYITAQGYGKNFLHGLGHGIGNRVHQYFRINPKSRVYLKPGFVFTIEPGIYFKGKFGVRLENVVYLSPKGPQTLTKL